MNSFLLNLLQVCFGQPPKSNSGHRSLNLSPTRLRKRFAIHRLLAVAGMATVLVPAVEAQLNVNGYRNAIIAELDGPDPDGVGDAVRAEAKRRGMVAFLSASDVSGSEWMQTCELRYSISWFGNWEAGATISIRVLDAASGELVVSGSGDYSKEKHREGNLGPAVERAWDELRYKRFNEKAHRANLAKIKLPEVPIEACDEEALRSRSDLAPAEGIWMTSDNRYVVLVRKDAERKYGDFVGLILRSGNPIWRRGELKFTLNEGAVPNLFIGDFYDGRKRKYGTTFAIKDGITLSTALSANGADESITFLRMFPKERTSMGGETPKGKSAPYAGTGFLISEDGYIVTNHHVVEGSKSVTVTFPMVGLSLPARIVVKDPRNDLAILRIEEFGLKKLNIDAIPYRLVKSQSVSLGDKISTIGFPLEETLGSNPKYSDGSISSKSGIDDDPATFQISAPVQPGSSGSPLFDESRRFVVGVVVARIRDAYIIAQSGAVPQNVNYAVKADYILNLIEMLPEPPNFGASAGTKQNAPDEVARCVVQIKAER